MRMSLVSLSVLHHGGLARPFDAGGLFFRLRLSFRCEVVHEVAAESRAYAIRPIASRSTILYPDLDRATGVLELGRHPTKRAPANQTFPSLEVWTVADDNNSNRTGSDKRKQSLYFPEIMLQEIKDEAARLDRSLSWVVQRAWKLARTEIRKIPSVNDIDDDESSPG